MPPKGKQKELNLLPYYFYCPICGMTEKTSRYVDNYLIHAHSGETYVLRRFMTLNLLNKFKMKYLKDRYVTIARSLRK